MKTSFDEVVEKLSEVSRELSRADYRALLEELLDEMEARIECLNLDDEMESSE